MYVGVPMYPFIHFRRANKLELVANSNWALFIFFLFFEFFFSGGRGVTDGKVKFQLLTHLPQVLVGMGRAEGEGKGISKRPKMSKSISGS